MGNIVITKTNGSKWASNHAWKIKNQASGLSATVISRGSRLVSLRFKGRELLATDPAAYKQLPLLKCPRTHRMWKVFGELGGEQTFVAPQSKWGIDDNGKGLPPFMFLNMGEQYALKEIEEGLIGRTAHCRVTGLSIFRQIELGDGPKAQLKISTHIESIASWTSKNVAPWSIMRLAAPSTTVVSNLAEEPTVFLHEPEGKLPEKGFVYNAEAQTATVDAPSPHPYKVGYRFWGRTGQVTTTFPATASQPEVSLQEDIVVAPGRYPHHGPFETYSCWNGPIESEVLIPSRDLVARQRTETLTRTLNLK